MIIVLKQLNDGLCRIEVDSEEIEERLKTKAADWDNAKPTSEQVKKSKPMLKSDRIKHLKEHGYTDNDITIIDKEMNL